MIDSTPLQQYFGQGLSYADYVATGSPEQQRRWQAVYEAASLTGEQRQRVAGFVRDMHVLVLSGIWCGDCVEQCPLLARIAEANPDRIHLRFSDRDEHASLQDTVSICGGRRVPVALFMAEDFSLCGWYGDRTLSRYRALAQRQIGAACPTGLVIPPADELSATLNDWLNEVERIQLMLRLSPRLRQLHGD